MSYKLYDRSEFKDKICNHQKLIMKQVKVRLNEAITLKAFYHSDV